MEDEVRCNLLERMAQGGPGGTRQARSDGSAIIQESCQSHPISLVA